MRHRELKAVVLDTDGSVRRQALEKEFAIELVGLTDLRNNLQFYADRHGIGEFAKRMEPCWPKKPSFYLLGSGDFHHLTLLILERLQNPFFLVIFDNHTDCSFLFPKYHCGNWMYHAAKLPNCRKVIHIGSTEGHGPFVRHMGLNALEKSGKVSILTGQEYNGPERMDKFERLINDVSLNGLPLYVSIDKDVLRSEESPGDWNNGVMSLGVLRKTLDVLAGREVAGADIAGEMGGKYHYRYKPIKNFLSKAEHPQETDGNVSEEIDLKQRTVNIEILEAFGVEHAGS